MNQIKVAISNPDGPLGHLLLMLDNNLVTCSVIITVCFDHDTRMVQFDRIIFCAPRIHPELREQRDEEDHGVGGRNREHHQEDGGGREHRRHLRQGADLQPDPRVSSLNGIQDSVYSLALRWQNVALRKEK